MDAYNGVGITNPSWSTYITFGAMSFCRNIWRYCFCLFFGFCIVYCLFV